MPRITPYHLRALVATVVLGVCLASPAQANGDSATVEHIVIVWLKEPGNPALQQRVIDASQVLRSIPGVLALKAGTVIPSQRPIVDSSFDVALIVSFPGKAALQAYLAHPVHIELVEKTLLPLVARIQVYDFSQP